MEARDFIEALISHGLTQMQIADRSGVRQSTVSKVSRGVVEDVRSQSYRALQRLYCEVFGIDLPEVPPRVAPDTCAGALDETQTAGA